MAAGEVPPPDVVKLDVEGGELAALRGAARVLRAHAPYVVFEANENMERFGYALSDLLASFPEQGAYRFYRVAAAGLEPLDETAAGFDVLAAPASRAAVS